MRRLLAVLAVFASLGYALLGCSSSGSSKPAVSHADALACRTVYRLEQLNHISPLAFSNQTATNALDESAVGTTKAFNAALIATSEEIGVIGYSNTLMSPLVNECTAMGITAKNAENVS